MIDIGGAADGRRNGYDERRRSSRRLRRSDGGDGRHLGITGASADDLVGGEQIAASDADDAASMATDGGRLLWSRQPGTRADDFAHGVATDGDGNVYMVGDTDGALGGRNKGTETRG